MAYLPDKPTITQRGASYSLVSLRAETTSYGDIGSGSCTFVIQGSKTSSTTGYDWYIANVQSPNFLYVTGNWANLSPNTKYWAKAYIQAGASDYVHSDPIEIGTTPDYPTISVTPGDRSVSVTYSVASDSGDFNKILSYSLDGTNYTDVLTITDGQTHSGSFTISNLQPRTKYTVYVKLSNEHGSRGDKTADFNTTTPYHLYGSVNGDTKDIKKLYGRASAQVYWEVTDIRGNTVDYNKFNAKYSETFGNMGEFKPSYFRVGTQGSNKEADLVLRGVSSGTSQAKTLFTWPSSGYTNEGADWGFSSEPVQSWVVTSTPVMGYGTKEVAKLYGSVNGQTKLVYVKENA